jgi:hypothetical protein
MGLQVTPQQVADQLTRMRITGNRRPSSPRQGGGGQGRWQPDSVEIMRSERIRGLNDREIADLIVRETGQVVTPAAVNGMRNRLALERMREALAADVAAQAERAPRLQAGRVAFAGLSPEHPLPRVSGATNQDVVTALLALRRARNYDGAIASSDGAALQLLRLWQSRGLDYATIVQYARGVRGMGEPPSGRPNALVPMFPREEERSNALID